MANRGVLSSIWQNFKQSITITMRSRELFVGTDHLGNRYFERTEDISKGIKRQRRVEAKNPDPTVVPELPVEWMTWLQGRRPSPPSPEEIERNLAIGQRIQAKAKEREQEWQSTSSSPSDQTTQVHTAKSQFPVYPEYEIHPGESAKKTQQKTDRTKEH